MSNCVISLCFLHAVLNFLSAISFLQAQDVSAIPFCKRIISWVSLQVVFSTWAKDIEKSSTASIFGLFSNLFDVSLHSSLPLVILHPVFLNLSHDPNRFTFPVITSALHTFKNSFTSLAAHMEEKFPLKSRFNGGINQGDKRRGKVFTRNLKDKNRVCSLSYSRNTSLRLGLLWIGRADCMNRKEKLWASRRMKFGRRWELYFNSRGFVGFAVFTL